MKIGIYMRLGNPDSESNSLEKQRVIIENFLKNKKVEIAKEFVDVGYSGNDWDRFGYKKLLESLENKEIDTVVVSEISRFGRDYRTLENISTIKDKYNANFISVNDFENNSVDLLLKIFEDEYKKFIDKEKASRRTYKSEMQKKEC